MDTLRAVSEKTNAGMDFYLLLGDFLDEYGRAENKAEMLNAPPETMSRPELLPFLAATAHRLANGGKFPPPDWVFDKRCYLPGGEPFFACNARGNLRLLFMYKSPPEFKHRNLFVDENVLSRV